MPNVNIDQLNIRIKGSSKAAVQNAIQDLGPELVKQLQQVRYPDSQQSTRRIDSIHTTASLTASQSNAASLRTNIASAVSKSVSRKLNATSRSTE